MPKTAPAPCHQMSSGGASGGCILVRRGFGRRPADSGSAAVRRCSMSEDGGERSHARPGTAATENGRGPAGVRGASAGGPSSRWLPMALAGRAGVMAHAAWHARTVRGGNDRCCRGTRCVGGVGQPVRIEARSDGRASRVFVAPPLRGAGVGRRLLEHAIEVARQLDREVWLDVMERSAAASFYRAQGWAVVERVRASWCAADGDRPMLVRYRPPAPCSLSMPDADAG